MMNITVLARTNQEATLTTLVVHEVDLVAEQSQRDVVVDLRFGLWHSVLGRVAEALGAPLVQQLQVVRTETA